jgi:hypothetical protein
VVVDVDVLGEGRIGDDVGRAEGWVGSAAAVTAVAGWRPRKTPELIFLVSDTSFLQAGVRFELSADVICRVN